MHPGPVAPVDRQKLDRSNTDFRALFDAPEPASVNAFAEHLDSNSAKGMPAFARDACRVAQVVLGACYKHFWGKLQALTDQAPPSWSWCREPGDCSRGVRSLGRALSVTAEFRWIVVGRRVVVVGPETTRNGVVAIDPHTIRSGVAWDHRLAGMNDNMPRFGVMHPCGIGRRTQSDQ
jgi:hypothetical protein